MPLELTWLGHSTVVVDVDGVRVVTDPLVGRHAGVLRRRGAMPARSAWAGADAVLLSHLHHDHAELTSLRRFGGVPVLTAPENAAWVRDKGMDGRGLAPGEWFPLVPGGRVAVCTVRAVHDSRPMPHRPNAVNGHLLRSPAGVVWFAGDTEVYPEMAELPRVAGGRVDLAVVPVGGWGPRLSPGHMGPGEAAVACRLTGARYAVPVHWKTLHAPAGHLLPPGWMDRAGPRFLEEVARQAPGCRAVELQIGESFVLPDDRG